MSLQWFRRMICKRRGHDWSAYYYDAYQGRRLQVCHRCHRTQPLTLTVYPDWGGD